jgi:hypothetical protein
MVPSLKYAFWRELGDKSNSTRTSVISYGFDNLY